MTKNIHNTRSEIIKHALPFIGEMGWTFTALIKGGIEAGLTECDVKIAFEGREKEAVKHYSYWVDQQMLQQLEANPDYPSMRITQKIRTALITRFEIANSYKKAAQKTARFLKNPAHMGLASQLLYKTVNEIWHKAGDTSTDYNFYTKRLILGTIYASTLAYWLKDDSADLERTLNFMDRRFKDSSKIFLLKSTVKDKINFLKAPARALLGKFFK